MPTTEAAGADSPATATADDASTTDAAVQQTQQAAADAADAADATVKVSPVLACRCSRRFSASTTQGPALGLLGEEVDSATLALLRDAGLTSLVLDSNNVANASTPRVTFGDFDALVADHLVRQRASRSRAPPQPSATPAPPI